MTVDWRSIQGCTADEQTTSIIIENHYSSSSDSLKTIIKGLNASDA